MASRTCEMERVGGRSRSDVDMISSLPDCLIHVIMSFLTSQEAVRTCLLSKRWEKLWTTLPFLDFDMCKFEYDGKSYESVWNGNSDIPKDDFKRFGDSVSMTLKRREHSDILNFRVSLWGNVPVSLEQCKVIRSWIAYAIKHNLQVFNFDYSAQCHDLLELPLGAFTCASLVDVSLFCIFHREIKVINLPRLKRLYLSCICLYKDFVEKLFCGCPVLEVLHLDDCLRKYSTISSQSLKYLVVDDCVPLEGFDEMELFDTPNLLSFYYTNFVDKFDGPKMLLVLKMPSLTYASISMSCTNIDWSDNCKNNILFGLSTVQNLTLYGIRIKDLLENELPNCPLFLNLKDLMVYQLDFCCHFNLLASFLDHCPNLEKLSLRCGVCYHEGNKLFKIEPFKGDRLKTVEVQFIRCDTTFPRTLKYLQYFTRNSRAQIIMTSLCNRPF